MLCHDSAIAELIAFLHSRDCPVLIWEDPCRPERAMNWPEMSLCRPEGILLGLRRPSIDLRGSYVAPKMSSVGLIGPYLKAFFRPYRTPRRTEQAPYRPIRDLYRSMRVLFLPKRALRRNKETRNKETKDQQETKTFTNMGK